MTTPSNLVEHFFRHEYGKLVATLTRRVGTVYLETIEDSVQFALMAALDSWAVNRPPNNPAAWLYKVASNKLISELRQKAGRDGIVLRHIDDFLSPETIDSQHYSSTELQDDMLRMLFVCCNSGIPVESQLVFTLKSLCGFSIREISVRLFITESNAYKRFSRSRAYLTQIPSDTWDLDYNDYSTRVQSVHTVLYLLFTEGYLSLKHQTTIRKELCDEALRLALILVDNKVGHASESFALVALMYFHSARLAARQDSSGGLLLLEQQDRSLWDKKKIQMGFAWLEKSSFGNRFSRYHAEAGIAAEHCLAASFQQTPGIKSLRIIGYWREFPLLQFIK